MLIGLVVFTLGEALTHYGQVYPDSPGYITTAHFFQGKASVDAAGFRLLRPVVPFLASILNYFVDIRTAFALINLVFWCSAAVLMFYFTKLLTKNVHASLLSAAAFTSAIPILLFGDAVLTDMAGYFFILLGAYLAVRWDLPRASLRRVCFLGLIMAVGMLSRESVATVLIFGSAWILASKGSVKRIVLLLAVPVGMSILWSYVIGVSYVAWYNQGGLAFAATHQQLTLTGKLFRLLGSIQYAFGRIPGVLILAFLGLLKTTRKRDLALHISFWVGALAVILAWPVIDIRFTFILFPSILPLAGMGLLAAYRIIFESSMVQMIWPSFRDSGKHQFSFLMFVVLAYVLVTNAARPEFISFPWNPYTDPSVSLGGIR